MPARCGPDIIEICKPETRLADNKRVRGRGENSLSHVRLEVKDGGSNQIDIVSPARYDGIRSDRRMPIIFKELDELFSHLSDGIALFGGGRADKSVWVAGRIAAILTSGVLSPVIRLAVFAFSADEPIFKEKGY